MDKPKPKQKIQVQSFDNPEFWVGDFAKFAQEIGYVSWAWNALHADLSDLFISLTGIKNPKVARAIWHSIRSDRSQRDMLKEVAKAQLEHDKECLSEINWLVEEINQLSGIRNTTAHVLWTVDHNISSNTRTLSDFLNNRKAKPDLIRGNPLGAKLTDKSARDLYNQLSGYCMTLIQFSRFLDCRVRRWDEGEALPERPERPHILGNH